MNIIKLPQWLAVAIVAVTLAVVGYVMWLVINFFRKKVNEHERINKDLALIQNLARDIAATLEMRDLLPQIMEAFAKAGNVAKGSIMLLNKDTQTLEIKAGIGLSKRAMDVVKPKLAEGVAGVVAATCESILIDDVSKEKYIYYDFNSQKSRPKETLLCMPLIAKGTVLGVVSLDKKSGGERFSEYDRRILSILANQAAIAIQNAQLYENAVTDGLTELYIHKYFHSRLEKEMERARRAERELALIMLDIDYFKSFNDRYGHQVGDTVLVQLGKILKKTMRSTDILARYGGEEFAVIVVPGHNGEITLKVLREIAERLRKNVETTEVKHNNMKFKITISIGVVLWHGEKKIDKDKLVKMADDALYRAKRAGRNRVCLWEEMYQTHGNAN